jgi:hypothetical protein
MKYRHPGFDIVRSALNNTQPDVPVSAYSGCGYGTPEKIV